MMLNGADTVPILPFGNRDGLGAHVLPTIVPGGTTPGSVIIVQVLDVVVVPVADRRALLSKSPTPTPKPTWRPDHRPVGSSAIPGVANPRATKAAATDAIRTPHLTQRTVSLMALSILLSATGGQVF